jgi:hypothetical protein
MNLHFANDVPANASGMGKFFSPTNLRLYRILMNDEVIAGERVRVLKVLAEEWDAFTRECRMAGVVRVGSSMAFAKDERQGDASSNQAIDPARENHLRQRLPLVLTSLDRDATPEEPQYEVKSDRSEHIALHKGSALKLALLR